MGRRRWRWPAGYDPDVITMDINLPGMSGIEATRAIAAQFPTIRVIGMSMFDDPARAQAMRDAGAVAYVTKTGPAEALLAAIHGRQ
jgi:DNA-binding NarL/FixJ family response regulator